jgi:hypothetical protein
MKNRPKRSDAMEHADPFDRRTLDLLYGYNDDSMLVGLNDMSASDHHDIFTEDLGNQDVGCGVGNDLCRLH